MNGEGRDSRRVGIHAWRPKTHDIDDCFFAEQAEGGFNPAGDTLVYEVEGNAVRVRKAEPFDLAWHRAISPTVAEWDSANDHENFDDL